MREFVEILSGTNQVKYIANKRIFICFTLVKEVFQIGEYFGYLEG